LDEPTGDLDTRSTDIVMKILLDLNIEKKITMIMVTHDVALKTYSNRVVKMTDGKISKLIDIDPQERYGAVKHLNDRVNLIHKGQGKDVLSIREGISDENDAGAILNTSEGVKMPSNVAFLKDIQTTKTSVRKPKDYPILRDRFYK
jgi:energy-coupling factor transporter ATP-binding protein EcfA2